MGVAMGVAMGVVMEAAMGVVMEAVMKAAVLNKIDTIMNFNGLVYGYSVWTLLRGRANTMRPTKRVLCLNFRVIYGVEF